jgi:ABC-type Fe3+-hydroxamate transport system substrate-binding protein
MPPIISLLSDATDFVSYFGKLDSVVAARSYDGLAPAGSIKLTKLDATMVVKLSKLTFDSPPKIIFNPDDTEAYSFATQLVQQLLLDKNALVPFEKSSFQKLLNSIEAVGLAVGESRKGREFSGRIKAQLLDWSSNFYERVRRKKVAILSEMSFEVPELEGWLASTIMELGAVPFTKGVDKNVSTLIEFRPDVLIILGEDERSAAAQNFRTLYDTPWDSLPAVKRGEVYFTAQKQIVPPSSNIIQGIAILVSCLAALESGFITPRDCYLRLRWVELHRDQL